VVLARIDRDHPEAGRAAQALVLSDIPREAVG
jgi:hypothetical protein